MVLYCIRVVVHAMMQCPEQGCNRKYKTDERLLRHLQNDHNKALELAADLVASATKIAPTPKGTRPAGAAAAASAELARAREDHAARAHIEEQRMRRIAENPSECCICFDQPAGGAAAIPCGHAYFCLQCITECYAKGKPCPFCRTHMTKVQQLYQ